MGILDTYLTNGNTVSLLEITASARLLGYKCKGKDLVPMLNMTHLVPKKEPKTF